MVFSRFFKRQSNDATTPVTPPSPAQPAPAAAPDHAALARRQAAEALLHREEVVDARNRLYGYRFSYRSLQAPGASSALLSALAAAEIGNFAQRRLAVIPITADAVLQDEYLPLAAPHSYFLFDLRAEASGFLASAAASEVFRRLHASGSRIALTGLDLEPATLPLAANADLVFLSLQDLPLQTFEQLARGLKACRAGLQLAAEAVHSWPERRMIAKWGFEYCLGDFLTTPDADEQQSRLDQSRLVLIEMLNLLRSDSDPAELGAIAKKDPGVALKLLGLANSPAAGLSSPVASLEQAILVLGRDRLYRWLSVSMFRVGQTRDRDEALLEVALVRARFLETVAAGSQARAVCDELFLVGLLSLFELLLATPLSQILERLRLPETVSEVLLLNTGPYARYLMLALAVEKGQVERATTLAGQLGLDATTLRATNQAALAWAEEALGYTTPADIPA